MHDPAIHHSPRLWLLAGTGDGLRLAQDLVQRGWRLLVTVVGAEAARAYPSSPGLELRVGPLAGDAAIRALLDQARQQGDPFQAVVDASHPFACRITAALARVWAGPGVLPPLLRLRRPTLRQPAVARLRELPGLADLAALPPEGRLEGRRLLLAIGGRQLGQVVALTPGAVHHARLLPSPAALQQGRAAGIPADRLACLRPGDPAEPALLRALLRRWRIEVILCRQSGGLTESLWRALAAELNLELLLLRRPAEPPGMEALELAPLLHRLEGLHPPFLSGFRDAELNRPRPAPVPHDRGE